jgi:GNAT superfamily N-acetyltransferase
VGGKTDIAWCRERERARELADFFASNVLSDASYISHSELQGKRALDPQTWRPDLRDILRREIEPRVSKKGALPRTRISHPIARAEQDSRLVGISFVTFAPRAPKPFAIVEDLVIDPDRRSHGIGKTMLDWIAEQARILGIRRLFLESGLTNKRAHHFFERQGFKPCSVVMMKEL